MSIRFVVSDHLRLALVVLATTVFACEDHGQEEDNPNAEACEHLGAAGAVAVNAATDASASAPEIKSDHQRYEVTITDASKPAFVTFKASEASDYLIFSNAPVTLTVTSATGAALAAESTAGSISECTTVKSRSVYPFAVGTYIIAIAPGAPSKVSFVIEPDHVH